MLSADEARKISRKNKSIENTRQYSPIEPSISNSEKIRIIQLLDESIRNSINKGIDALTVPFNIIDENGNKYNHSTSMILLKDIINRYKKLGYEVDETTIHTPSGRIPALCIIWDKISFKVDDCRINYEVRRMI